LHALLEAGGERVAVYGLENDEGKPIYVHAKACIIDDKWACIGSDNTNRRSWSHDSELSAAFVDGGTVRRLRHTLSTEHLQGAASGYDLDDPRQWFYAFRDAAGALDAWHSSGRVGPRPPGRLRPYRQEDLPRLTGAWATVVYRLFYDPDGRDLRRRLIRRFAAELSRLQVTHLLPNIEILALFAAAARPLVAHPMKYLVTFQGYEVYANYAREMGCEAALYARLADVVASSDWPAIAVSDAYCERIRREVHVPAEQLRSIPPGIPVHEPLPIDRAHRLVCRAFPHYRDELPLIAYVGRRDAEKGLDLLLYAARMLESRGVRFQLAICGPTAFGSVYEQACSQIAQHLRVPVLTSGYVSTELRAALFRTSRAVVYPSIHEEPFGMVPVEAMAQGTPVVVPNIGGVASVAQVGAQRGGLHFASWDTRDLADQLQALIEQHDLHAALSTGAPHIAEHFSVANLGERVLDHLELPHWYGSARPASETPSDDPTVAVRRAA
jgi:glycosyltransferase involved in cell wall biosynthesis